MSLTVCMYGLGQSGGRLATDFLAAGVDVYAFDPAPVATPMGAVRASHPALAAARADVIIAAVPASQSELALLQAIEVIPLRAVYADASDASPVAKLDLAERALQHEVSFADLSLGHNDRDGAPAHGRWGTLAPEAVTGPGARALVDRLSRAGFPVEASEGPVGSARVRRCIQRGAAAGVGAILAEMLAAIGDPDDRQALLEEIAQALTSGDAWPARLVERAIEPPTDLEPDVADLANYLQRLGADSLMTESLALRLRNS